MERFPYHLTAPVGRCATMGLIALQVDQTVEQDFRRLFPGADIALHVGRVPSGAHLTPETIATMENALPYAASLLPPAAQFDVVGYACTSGTTLIGADRVADLVKGAAATRHVSDPLTAALAGFRALGVSSLAMVSPYIDTVCEPIRAAFQANGLTVAAGLSFGEEVEARVARIDPASVRAAALAAGAAPGTEAVFLSCTNLRTLDVIADIEAELAKPVLSSNQALAWHMAKLAGDPGLFNGPGRLARPRPAA